MTTPTASLTLTVDGEVWEVARSHGRYNFTWLSGPTPGSGFSSTLSNGHAELPLDAMRKSIRNFMTTADPETGVLD